MGNFCLSELTEGNFVKLDFSKKVYEVVFKKYQYILLKSIKNKKHMLIDTQKAIAYYNEKQLEKLYDEVDFVSFIQYLDEGRVNLSKKCKINLIENIMKEEL